MLFSLLCPSRERPEGLQRMLESLQKTIGQKDQVEILIAIDEDDIVNQTFLTRQLARFKDLDIHIHQRPRSEFLNRDYYNWLAAKAKGDYLWASGDDLVYLVDGWDLRLKPIIETYLSDKPDRIFCASIKDSTPKPKELKGPDGLPIPFPCFPLIPRESFKALGFLLHPEIPTWGADYALYMLYKGVDRVLVIDNFTYIDHVSHHTYAGEVKQDVVNKRIELIASKYNVQAGDGNSGIFVRRHVPKQIETLKKIIDEAYPGKAN
jgi:hypothetical protein